MLSRTFVFHLQTVRHPDIYLPTGRFRRGVYRMEMNDGQVDLYLPTRGMNKRRVDPAMVRTHTLGEIDNYRAELSKDGSSWLIEFTTNRIHLKYTTTFKLKVNRKRLSAEMEYIPGPPNFDPALYTGYVTDIH